MHSHTKQTHKHLAKWCVCMRFYKFDPFMWICHEHKNKHFHSYRWKTVAAKNAKSILRCWDLLVFFDLCDIFRGFGVLIRQNKQFKYVTFRFWENVTGIFTVFWHFKDQTIHWQQMNWAAVFSKMCFWSSLIHLDVWPSMRRMCSLQFYMYILYKMLQWHHN